MHDYLVGKNNEGKDFILKRDEEDDIIPNPDDNDKSSDLYLRWKWLIEGWDKWSNKERFRIAAPYFVYIRRYDEIADGINDLGIDTFSVYLSDKVAELEYILCRYMKKIHADVYGTKMIHTSMVEFYPVSFTDIPDKFSELKASIRAWAVEFAPDWLYKDIETR